MTIGAWQEDALYAINPLLKQPIFEIKEIILEEIKRLKRVVANSFHDEDGWGKEDERTLDESIVEELIQEFAEELDLSNEQQVELFEEMKKNLSFKIKKLP